MYKNNALPDMYLDDKQLNLYIDNFLYKLYKHLSGNRHGFAVFERAAGAIFLLYKLFIIKMS